MILSTEGVPGQVHPPGTRYTPPSSACREIRATSGWYASYWNAFLLFKIDTLCVFELNLVERFVQLFVSIHLILASRHEKQ